MEIPTITIEDDSYIYYPNGTIYHKRLNRFTCLSKRKDGYLQVRINGKMKYVHRVIYEKFVGKIPEAFDVDHINNVRDDNILENLQLLTRQENSQKQIISKRNTSGLTGISFRKDRDCWTAQIEKNRKNIFYKSGFETKEVAATARNKFIDDNPVLCKFFIKCDI